MSFIQMFMYLWFYMWLALCLLIQNLSINVSVAQRKFTTFNASSDLPFDLEDALHFWITKVCLAVEHQVDRDRKTHQANIMQSAAPAVSPTTIHSEPVLKGEDHPDFN